MPEVMRRLLVLAVLVLAGCEVSSVPTPAQVTTTVDAIASTVASPETTTTAPAPTSTTAPRSTVATVPPTTTAEPELCPGLAHPAHHQPCPPETTAPPARPAEPCARALVGVRAVGLPAGWAFHCGTAVMIRQQGRASAGLAGWNTTDGNFIAINPVTGDHPGVGAHEACHAVDFVTRGATSEASADACAAAHGHPNPFAGVDDVVIGDSAAERAQRWLVDAVLVVVLVLVVALLTLLPALRRRLRNGHRKDCP